MYRTGSSSQSPPKIIWLFAQQHADGYWFEQVSPDPVWLTVLVLDAIELASGGRTLTFTPDTVPSIRPLVFVAYQHKDTKWLNQLRDHLGTLIHRGRIEFFNDREIKGGREWDPEIREKLNAAKVIVPLISPNFLGSAYIQTVELPTAMSRQKQGKVVVLPVLLEDCDWEYLRASPQSTSCQKTKAIISSRSVHGIQKDTRRIRK